MNILELINIGSSKLKYKNIASYKLDAEILLSKVLKTNRERLVVNQSQIINSKQILEFNKLINRRVLNEPMAYILKEKEFWSKKFIVCKDTLIPRPETELLVEKLVKIFKKKTIRFLDIGTGAGCILISLLTELKDSFGVGIDLSNKAVLIANKNVDKHLLKDKKRVRVYRRSFSQFFNKKFDLIVCNPPYISTKDLKNLNDDIKKYEPKLALDGGNDGLDVIQKVIYKSKEILKIKGLLALEIGNGQNKKVSKILKKNKFKIEYVIEEYPGSTRCLISSYSN